jgi:hypothetical protein
MATADGGALFLSLGYFAFVVAALALVWFSPRPGANIAVLVSPFARAGLASQIVAEAGGDIIERGRWPNLLIIKTRSPHAIARLYGAGAWLVFNPNAVAGCFQEP